MMANLALESNTPGVDIMDDSKLTDFWFKF